MKINIKSYHSYLLIAVTFLLYPILKGMEVHWQGDTKDYQEAANTILNGYHQINFRVPFYPLLLILTNSTQKLTTSLFVLQYLLYFISIVFVVKAMLKSGLKEWHIFVTTLILVSPPLVQMNYHALTEAVSFALVNILFSIFVLLKRSYKFFVMGLVAAALTLTRPSFQITGLLLTILFFFIEKRKIRAAFFLVTFLTPLLVFSFFNKSRFDFFGITPATGWHLTTKTASFIDNWPDKKIRPLMIRQRNDNLLNKTSHTGSLFVWSLPGLLQDSLQMNFVQVSKYMMKNNVQLIKSEPLDYLSSVGKNFIDYTFPNADHQSFPAWCRALTFIIQFAYMYLAMILTVTTLVCLWLLSRNLYQDWLYPFLFASIVVYTNYFISIATEIGSPRHRAPTEGLILVIIAFALPIIGETKRLISAVFAVSSKPALNPEL